MRRGTAMPGTPNPDTDSSGAAAGLVLFAAVMFTVAGALDLLRRRTRSPAGPAGSVAWGP
ncbi:hypothetical protein [Streptomyces sp. HB2AG]|uniref:hypothetical protein n=1 Tax=Streptomyces sp. HB2AG TaxID=2983400 RepID=UPI0022AA4654|nr:hypothetical protein [Streptomyces sp. HB2AG]MCZ2524085.1 hypothetical protein [Streptomyces sp. HB2AG]